MKKQKLNSAPYPSGKNLFSDIYDFILERPQITTCIRFKKRSEHQNFSARILQRLNVNVGDYTILNIHKIGINAPGRYIFDVLLTWDNHSPYWPNKLAHVKRIDGLLNHIHIHLFGIERILSFKKLSIKGLAIPPLFRLEKHSFNFSPRTADLDNARSLLYDCGGGYPIGIFSVYVRSSIKGNNENETSQLFFMVAFDFFGRKKGFPVVLLKWFWEKIHNRVTAHILNYIKTICENNFQQMTVG